MDQVRVKNGRLSRSYIEKMVTVCLFLLIPTVLLIVFTYIPAAEMIKFSFEQRDEFGVNVQNVGLKNYKTVFSTQLSSARRYVSPTSSRECFSSPT